MITVVKIGGNIIDNKSQLQAFIRDFVQIKGKKILVHGGGKLATDLAKKMDIPQQMVEGRRITDQDTLDVITMVYGGLINKNMVAALHAEGCVSLGVCGADSNLLLAHRREVKQLDYGFVGDIDYVNASMILQLINLDICLVVAPITHDGKGQLLNTNADTMASAIASALAPMEEVKLVYCFEKPGVLSDPNDDRTVIPILNSQTILDWKMSGSIHSGMLPKIDNAMSAVQFGVDVTIGHAASVLDIIAGQSGTKITI